MMDEYQLYPVTMAHPAYKAAQSLLVPGTERLNGQRQPIPGTGDYQGTPERMPPVTVNSDEERKYYEAQGYKFAGDCDPSAYAVAHSSSPPDAYVPLEYPKYVGVVLVNSREEEDELSPPLIPPAIGDGEDVPAKNRGGRPRKVEAA